MNTSDELGELADALSKAQSEFDSPKKTKTAKIETFSFKYAPLDEVIECVQKVLTKYGLCITQCPRADTATGIIVETRIIHVSGQWIESSLWFPYQERVDRNGVTKVLNSPKDIGAMITYGRRYSLASILNIATDEDNEDTVPRSRERKAPTQNELDNQLKEYLGMIHASKTLGELSDVGSKIRNFADPVLHHSLKEAYQSKLDELKELGESEEHPKESAISNWLSRLENSRGNFEELKQVAIDFVQKNPEGKGKKMDPKMSAAFTAVYQQYMQECDN